MWAAGCDGHVHICYLRLWEAALMHSSMPAPRRRVQQNQSWRRLFGPEYLLQHVLKVHVPFLAIPLHIYFALAPSDRQAMYGHAPLLKAPFERDHEVCALCASFLLGEMEVPSPRRRYRHRLAGGPGAARGGRGGPTGWGESMYQNSGRHRTTAPPFLI